VLVSKVVKSNCIGSPPQRCQSRRRSVDVVGVDTRGGINGSASNNTGVGPVDT
jgi:hypothetical protein